MVGRTNGLITACQLEANEKYKGGLPTSEHVVLLPPRRIHEIVIVGLCPCAAYMIASSCSYRCGGIFRYETALIAAAAALWSRSAVALVAALSGADTLSPVLGVSAHSLATRKRSASNDSHCAGCRGLQGGGSAPISHLLAGCAHKRMGPRLHRHRPLQPHPCRRRRYPDRHWS